jgi:hypothetical protein
MRADDELLFSPSRKDTSISSRRGRDFGFYWQGISMELRGAHMETKGIGQLHSTTMGY